MYSYSVHTHCFCAFDGCRAFNFELVDSTVSGAHFDLDQNTSMTLFDYLLSAIVSSCASSNGSDTSLRTALHVLAKDHLVLQSFRLSQWLG